ncbi:MAG: CBS and ACT domain-containing protein [Desulfovibrionaceae bacterium]|nr:CBS and ACT domain-containing protein [Desulfovibrionaceae bacterium]
MLIQNWMTRNPATVTPETSMLKASKLMKERHIRRLPVVNEHGQLVGIVSDRDLKEASPSKATSLDMHEMYYLLSELKVKDVMTRNPITVREDDLIDLAALLMEEKKVGGFPVLDAEGRLTGVITGSDVFKCLTRFTGARMGGLLLAFERPDQPGELRPILDMLYEHGASIISVLTTHETVNGLRRLYIRVRPMKPESERHLVNELTEAARLVFWRNAPE